MTDRRKVDVKCLEDIENVPLPVYKDLQVIHREEWGAVARKDGAGVQDGTFKLPIPFVTLTHSGKGPCKNTKECTKVVREMQKHDMEERGLSDIQYSFIIGGDGRIYQGRGWDLPPPENPQCPELHGKCLEIVFIGKHDETPLPFEMSSPAYDLLQILMWDNILHKEMKIKHLIKFVRHPNPDPLSYREEIVRSMARPAPGCADCSCKETAPVDSVKEDTSSPVESNH